MIGIYMIITVIVSFIGYKLFYAEFTFQGLESQTRYDSATRKYTTKYVKKQYGNEWVARSAFWKWLAISIFWPIVLPLIGAYKILESLYNKLNINKLQIFKKNEEISKRISSVVISDSRND